MRKVFAILLMLALLAGVLFLWRSGHAFSLTAGASSASGSAQLVDQADATNSCFCVTGKPTISAAFIGQVLASSHSPASGTAQALYNLGVKSGINPVYALAIFKHESLFGRAGMARITLSLGNIRCSPGYRCINGYRAYRSWQAGYADWYHLMATVYVAHGLMTIPHIIPVYAPASDGNDVNGYIAAIEQSVTLWQEGKNA